MSTSKQPTGRHPNVVNLTEVEARPIEQGTRFGATVKGLGRASGGTRVGCNWFEVPPGRAAFPFHYHCAMEEAIYVLEGRGTLRFGDQELELHAGDYATFPVGPDHAHQLINSGEDPLRYLCLSNNVKTEVIGYPDSDKVAALASSSHDHFAPAWMRAIFPAGSTVGYYDGEELD